LKYLYTKFKLGALNGETILESPLPVTLLELQIFSANQSSRLANDKTLSYDLSRIANSVKNDDKLFHNLAETLLHDSYALESDPIADAFSDWTSWKFWYMISTPFLTVLHLSSPYPAAVLLSFAKTTSRPNNSAYRNISPLKPFQ
jgi:hypothetical protein